MKISVNLIGVSAISDAERGAAEARYLELLEEVFAGPDNVLRRWAAAQEGRAMRSGGTNALPTDAERNISRWEHAASVAAKLALGSISGDLSAAVFEVRQGP